MLQARCLCCSHMMSMPEYPWQDRLFLSWAYTNSSRPAFGSGQDSISHACLMWLTFAAQDLSRSEDNRKAVSKKLAVVGAALEKAFKGPQDVEGALVGSDVYIVQTRPQP